MSIGFFVIVPVLFWLFIVMLVIAVAKPARRNIGSPRQSSSSQRYSGGYTKPVQMTKSFDRPKMREGLFDMKLGKSPQKKDKQGIFTNTDFDDYSVLSRKKDYVTGYNKKYAKDSIWSRRSTTKQYSHTYDGHEPWDKCMPKEKDPWDKDFYV